MTESDYAALLAKQLGGSASPKKRSKSPHEKVTEDGFTFDSGAEHGRYRELKLLLHAGVIKDLRVHTPWGLVVNGNKVGTYKDDFDYWERRGEGWEFVCEDVKSEWTQKDRVWRRTKKLMLAIHKITIREIVR